VRFLAIAAVCLACSQNLPPVLEHPEGPPVLPENTEPITAPAEQWTWVDFPGSRCINGGASGIGVSLNPGSSRVAIYLEGGGACFDPLTCAVVANRTGYKQGEFDSDVQSGLLDSGAFNRDDPDNPFRDFNFIWVPYCSGDVFSGNNPSGAVGGGSQQFLGYQNIGLFLQRLVPTFATATQVVLAGSSAGGVGAAYNYDRVAQAFGDVPVLLLDDSGIVLSDTYMKPCEQAQWRSDWGMGSTLPSDCPECTGSDGGGLVNLALHIAAKYPDRRMGLIVSEQDAVFRQFFSFGYSPGCNQLGDVPADVFQAGVDELRDQLLAPYPNFRLYSVASTKHVYLGENPVGDTTSGGVKLTDWLRALLDGGPGFVTVRP
jgi:hypothetical protein